MDNGSTIAHCDYIYKEDVGMLVGGVIGLQFQKLGSKS